MLPGVSRIILPADQRWPRYSEGDVIELKDGRLLLALARKNGASDFAKGTLIAKFSRDGGASWDDETHELLGPFDDVSDLMSVSLLRTKRGVHLLFLGRGPDAHADTRVYQLISDDEGKTWGKPRQISVRGGYHIVNNARLIATNAGRLIVPVAWVSENINKQFNHQRVFCLLSDDEGETWKESGELLLENEPLMEPGVAQCADGSLYMTIRTKLGVLYEARSRDNGATWTDLAPAKLSSPAAPSTVVRDPKSKALWMFWINRAKGGWKDRTPLAFARSDDHGSTWSQPRNIEDAKDHSYGYVSVDVVSGHALLTYYDWQDRGQTSFDRTNLRQRIIPLAWLRDEPTPPVFATERAANDVHPATRPAQPKIADAVSDDSVVTVQSAGGAWEAFAAMKTSAGDQPTTQLAIGRAASSDPKSFPPLEVVLQTDAADGDPPGAKLMAMAVLRYRGFYLGILHILDSRSGAVQAEWTWSHDGQSWARTWTKCIALGDEGSFDSRMILMGEFEISRAKMLYWYRGCDWRHDEKAGEAVMGLASTPRAALEDWLDTLPQP